MKLKKIFVLVAILILVVLAVYFFYSALDKEKISPVKEIGESYIKVSFISSPVIFPINLINLTKEKNG